MDALANRKSLTGDPDRAAATIAPDCTGLNFYALDRGLRDLLPLYLSGNDFAKLQPHFDRLDALSRSRGVSLPRTGDKDPPLLNPHDRCVRDVSFSEYRDQLRENEYIPLRDFQCHAMILRSGALGMEAPLPA